MAKPTAKHQAEEVHEQIQRHWEHDQEWATCIECGAQWSVVEAIDESGRDYEDFEEVSAGDGYCDRRFAEESRL